MAQLGASYRSLNAGNTEQKRKIEKRIPTCFDHPKNPSPETPLTLLGKHPCKLKTGGNFTIFVFTPVDWFFVTSQQGLAEHGPRLWRAVWHDGGDPVEHPDRDEKRCELVWHIKRNDQWIICIYIKLNYIYIYILIYTIYRYIYIFIEGLPPMPPTPDSMGI